MDVTIELDSQSGNHCWWCLYDKENKPMVDYLGDVPVTIADYCIGKFCSFECCYAFLVLHDFPAETTAMLHKYFQKNNEQKSLHRAPPPFVLRDYYGGGLSYEEYRKSHHMLQKSPLHSAVNTTKKYVDVKMEIHAKRKRKIEALMSTF